MKKIGWVIATVCVCAIIVGVMGIKANQNVEPEAPIEVAENSEITENTEAVTVATNHIIVNEIQNIASGKVMADSVMLTKEDLPEELASVANITGKDADMIYAVYTKTDYEKEEFDLLHDYVLNFFDEENETSIKVSATKEENPIRDYFFQRDLSSPSMIENVEVTIFQYEDRYIVNFAKGDYHFDIETNGLSQEEMLELVTKIIK